jgi:hypothetical protein
MSVAIVVGCWGALGSVAAVEPRVGGSAAMISSDFFMLFVRKPFPMTLIIIAGLAALAWPRERTIDIAAGSCRTVRAESEQRPDAARLRETTRVGR